MAQPKHGSGPSHDRLVSIGHLAALTGVSSRTLRYYEEVGILPTPERSSGGTRKYPRDYRFYVEGALALKELGFVLDEIRLIGRTALGEDVTEPERRRALDVIDRKRSLLERKIRLLQKMQAVLREPAQSPAGIRALDELCRAASEPHPNAGSERVGAAADGNGDLQPPSPA